MASPDAEQCNTQPATVDKWIHRSANMSCDRCMYYVPKANSGPPRPELGRCRRRAPTMNGWPVMFPGDWCGDHKLDETK